jgi:hypothetical protein
VRRSQAWQRGREAGSGREHTEARHNHHQHSLLTSRTVRISFLYDHLSVHTAFPVCIRAVRRQLFLWSWQHGVLRVGAGLHGQAVILHLYTGAFSGHVILFGFEHFYSWHNA